MDKPTPEFSGGPSGTSPIPPKHILVVDDEEAIRDLLVEIITRQGHRVTTAAEGREAIDLLGAHRFDLVITDMLMPRVGGAEVVRAAKAIDLDYPVIVMTAFPSEEASAPLERLGVINYLTKPFPVDAIIEAVAKLLPN